MSSFTTLTLTSKTASLSSSDIKNRQLWLFDYPHDFDIQSFHTSNLEIPSHCKEGQIVTSFTVDQTKYNVIECTAEVADITNLLPNSEQNGFQSGPKFTRYLSIVKSIDLPTISEDILVKFQKQQEVEHENKLKYALGKEIPALTIKYRPYGSSLNKKRKKAQTESRDPKILGEKTTKKSKKYDNL